MYITLTGCGLLLARMPIHAGCTVCHADDLAAGILDCGATGTPGADDGPGFLSDCGVDGGTGNCAGRHDLDQVSKDDEFCAKKDEFCTKNDELYTKNDELCTKTT